MLLTVQRKREKTSAMLIFSIETSQNSNFETARRPTGNKFLLGVLGYTNLYH